MTAFPYADLGPGGYDPHGYLNNRFGTTWRIQRHPTPDGQYWTASRHERAPTDATAYGVRNWHAGWMRPADLWRWLKEQETARQHWHNTQHPN